MWQDIVLQSGNDNIHSPSLLLTSLPSDSNAAANGNELLLEATNHATELEHDASEQRERNRALSCRLGLLEEDRNNLQASLSKEISYLRTTNRSKDEEIHELKGHVEEIRQVLQETQTSKDDLSRQLNGTRASLDHLQEKGTKGNQDLKEMNLNNAALAEKVQGLQERIRQVSLSKVYYCSSSSCNFYSYLQCNLPHQHMITSYII